MAPCGPLDPPLSDMPLGGYRVWRSSVHNLPSSVITHCSSYNYCSCHCHTIKRDWIQVTTHASCLNWISNAFDCGIFLFDGWRSQVSRPGVARPLRPQPTPDTAQLLPNKQTPYVRRVRINIITIRIEAIAVNVQSIELSAICLTPEGPTGSFLTRGTLQLLLPSVLLVIKF